MGKFLGTILILAVLACPAFAAQPMFTAEVSVDSTNTNTPITGMPGPGGNRAYTVVVVNDGPDEIFMNFTDGVATATGAPLGVGESLTVTAPQGTWYITNVGLICAAAESAMARIFAFPSKGDQ